MSNDHDGRETGMLRTARLPEELRAIRFSKHSGLRRILLLAVGIALLLFAGWLGDVIGHVIRGSTSPGTLSYERAAGLSDAIAGNCVGAVNLLAPAVAADASDMEATEALGNCDVALRKYDSAIPLLEAAASSLRSLSSEIALANAAFFSGDLNLVNSSLKSSVAHFRTPAELLSIAGSAQSYGLYAVSFTALSDVPRTKRTSDWYVADAQTLLDLDFHARAVTAAQRAEQISPTSERSETFAAVGNIYESVGNYRDAVTALRAALASGQSNLGSIYEELSQCYLVLDHYQSAFEAAVNGITNSTGGQVFSLELAEATALGDLHEKRRAVRVLERITTNRLAPANIVDSASALLSTIDG
jgi:tetratricopeptide (TPR) repeat protein